ncbi:DeoR/GlpR family DNA-binding transcription regulator [Paracoccus sp. M683]|uniref:DeoR/GlpR family DNA-binding transcription regulator n=1 Tax=Paracoccus sp. M683 TaxID=2594268 RepID=UPI00163D8E1F|nr:DeoR/GlpR family DNA-binding transcription regulator [Paracoccus sp. M683]
MTQLDQLKTSALPRLRKADRRKQILLDLKLRPHLRISELAERFGVSTETVRRDVDALAGKGLIDRAHGGASRPVPGPYPSLDERQRDRRIERERIGRLAAGLVQPGETLMVDSGSTTLQMARFLAFAGTPCRVITNSLHIAMTLGSSDRASVILCPGDYLARESAVIGDEALEFLARYHVDRAMIGATALHIGGVLETVPGFAAIKRRMLAQAAQRHLLIHGDKFGGSGFRKTADLDQLHSVLVDRAPPADLARALQAAGTRISIAD